MSNVPKNILALPLEVRAEMAMKAAVKKVIQEHARLGRPLILWRNGKVVAVPANEVLKEELPDDSSETQ